jgi:hypothetical protein
MSTAQYADPSQVRMENGRSLADLMRRGPGGLRGVVVAKSTPGGLPVNYNPHDRSHLEVHVEPEGGNAVLTMDRVTSEAVAQALAVANQAVQGNDIDSIRERAALAFEELAKISKSGVKRVPVKKTAATPPPREFRDDAPEVTEEREMLEELEQEVEALRSFEQPFPRPAAPPIEKIDRGYSPMAAFGLKKGPMATTSAPVVAKSSTSGPPQKLVYFEKEGIGTVPAFFHDVLIHVARPEPDSPEESGFIVLVYDVRFEQSAARWFPPSNDPYARPWAAKVSDDNRLYLVHTTGFQYIYDSREYCVLRVEKALWAPEGSDE